jgi:hypothetical protein
VSNQADSGTVRVNWRQTATNSVVAYVLDMVTSDAVRLGVPLSDGRIRKAGCRQELKGGRLQKAATNRVIAVNPRRDLQPPGAKRVRF